MFAVYYCAAVRNKVSWLKMCADQRVADQLQFHWTEPQVFHSELTLNFICIACEYFSISKMLYDALGPGPTCSLLAFLQN